jgi:hypothetical protein
LSDVIDPVSVVRYDTRDLFDLLIKIDLVPFRSRTLEIDHDRMARSVRESVSPYLSDACRDYDRFKASVVKESAIRDFLNP